MKNKKILIIILTITILAIIGGSVYAYITSQIEAKGQIKINLSNANIQITKNQMQDNKLNVELQNCGEAEQFVRVKIIAPEFTSLTSNSTYWNYNNDGYWYYSNMLKPGEKSSVLQIEIDIEEAKTRDFKIITNVESTNAMYDENGNLYVDWQFTYEY